MKTRTFSLKNISFLLLIFFFASSFCLVSCNKKDKASTENLESGNVGKNDQLVELPNGIMHKSDGENLVLMPETESWAEDVQTLAEEERIAKSLENLDGQEVSESGADGGGGEGSGGEGAGEAESESEWKDEIEKYVTEKSAKIDDFFKNPKQSFSYSDSTGQVNIFEFDNELVLPQVTDDGYLVTYSVGKDVQRFFYDKDYLLQKKEVWTISSATDYKLNKTLEYKYSEGKDKEGGAKKTISQIKETSPDSIITSQYNDDGLLTKKSVLAIFEEKDYQKSLYTCKYTKDNKVLQTETIDFIYNNEKYEKLIEKKSRKYLYHYADRPVGEDEIQPDYDYYENDTLKIRNIYSNEKGKWSSQIFFDKGYSVKSYYEDFVCVEEVYFLGKSLLRRVKK